MFKVLKSLLPYGDIFNSLGSNFENILRIISVQLDKIHKVIPDIWTIEHNQESWSKCLKSNNNLKLTKLKISSTGGQNKEYFGSVIRPMNEDGYVDFKKTGEIDIHGAKVIRNDASCSDHAGKEIVSYLRDESFIKAIEEIKHAHIKANYF